jgi:hypothetical protein
MRFRRWIIVLFSAVQLLGIGCSWLWEHPPSAVSSVLWGTAFLALFPGNLLGAWIVEKLFWQSRLSLVSIGIFSTVLLVVINATIWIVVVKGLEVIYVRLSARSGISTPPSPKPTR